MPKKCFYQDFVEIHGQFVSKGPLINGTCYGFVSHEFLGHPKATASAVVEDATSGKIVIVPAVCVRFTVPGNEDKW